MMKNLFKLTPGYDGENIINDMLCWSARVDSMEILGLIRILLCQYKSVPRTNRLKDQMFDLLNSMVEQHREYVDKHHI